MATLVADGYLSDGARTEAEMQTALEDIRDILAELGSAAPVTKTIDAGGEISQPTSRFIKVQVASATNPDILDAISVTNIDQGRFVLLQNADTASTTSSGEYVTVEHGIASASKEIHLADDTDFVLSGERKLMLCRVGNFWEEVWRSYGRANGEDIIAERTWLGLGTASEQDVAVAIGSTAGKVLKVGSSHLTNGQALLVDSSGEIYGGTADGGDADTLSSLAHTDFVRSTGGAAQTITGSLTVEGTTVTTDSTSGTGLPGISLTHSGVERGSLFHDNATGEVELRSRASGGAYTAALRLNPANSRVEVNSNVSSSTWESILPGAGNGLDADMLDGKHFDEIIQSTITGSGLRDADCIIDLGTSAIVIGTLSDLWSRYWYSNNSYQSANIDTHSFGVTFSAPPIILTSFHSQVIPTLEGNHGGTSTTDDIFEINSTTQRYTVEQVRDTSDVPPDSFQGLYPGVGNWVINCQVTNTSLIRRCGVSWPSGGAGTYNSADGTWGFWWYGHRFIAIGPKA